MSTADLAPEQVEGGEAGGSAPNSRCCTIASPGRRCTKPRCSNCDNTPTAQNGPPWVRFRRANGEACLFGDATECLRREQHPVTRRAWYPPQLRWRSNTPSNASTFGVFTRTRPWRLVRRQRAGEYRHWVGDVLDEVQHQHDVERRTLVEVLYSTRHETMARGFGDGAAVVEVTITLLVIAVRSAAPMTHRADSAPDVEQPQALARDRGHTTAKCLSIEPLFDPHRK